MLRNVSVMAVLLLLAACTSAQEPQNEVGDGRDERSLSPCACLKMETKGNEGLDAYKLYLKKQLAL